MSLYHCSAGAAFLPRRGTVPAPTRVPVEPPSHSMLSEMRFRNPTKTDKTYTEIIQYLYREKCYMVNLSLKTFQVGMYMILMTFVGVTSAKSKQQLKEYGNI